MTDTLPGEYKRIVTNTEVVRIWRNVIIIQKMKLLQAVLDAKSKLDRIGRLGMRLIGLANITLSVLIGLCYFTACQTGISNEERTRYLKLASEYNLKTTQAQAQSDKYYAEYLEAEKRAERAKIVSTDWDKLAKDYDSLAEKWVSIMKNSKSSSDIDYWPEKVRSIRESANDCRKKAMESYDYYLDYKYSADDYKRKSGQYADIARENRQQANHYKALAEQK